MLGLLSHFVAFHQAAKMGVPVKDNPSVVGDLRIFPDFKSKFLGNQRTIRVWLPPGYDKNSTDRYPVLYMEDGQNLFDKALSPFSHAEWRCDETATALINSKLIPPIIIVGIDNLDRNDEYLPTYDSKEKFGGKAALYAKFVIKEVKPFVDNTFRTKPDRANTGTGGSSLGADISLYLAMIYPKVFSKFIFCSPATWPDHHAMINQLRNYSPKIHGLVWEDIGTGEHGTQDPDSKTLCQLLQAHGLVLGKTLAYYVDHGAPHSETAWQNRFGFALLFLYGKSFDFTE